MIDSEIKIFAIGASCRSGKTSFVTFVALNALLRGKFNQIVYLVPSYEQAQRVIEEIEKISHKNNIGFFTTLVQGRIRVCKRVTCEKCPRVRKTWNQLIGDDPAYQIPGAMLDGFDDLYNKYVWSMNVTSDNKLWIGTVNVQPQGSTPIFDTKGCEVWYYDGSSWSQKVGNESGEIANGFGDKYNEGARSMREYPTGSGDLWVGTFHLESIRWQVPEKGCEVWRREST